MMAVPGHMQGPPGTMVMPQGMHPQQVQAQGGTVGSTVNLQQHQHAAPGNPPQAPAPTHIQQGDTDPISKFKSLLPKLKEALSNLFKVGGHLFYQNANQDENGIQIDKPSGRFEESLEDFYTLCDHIEMQLKLAQEILQQDKDSKINTPMAIVPPKTDTGQAEGQLYSQYISTIRTQITCAKEIRDLLHDGLKNTSEHSHP